MTSRVPIYVWFALILVLFTQDQVTSWNDASRFATIEAVVEQGTFAIERTRFAKTGDRIFHAGHFYSDKPPSLSLLGAGVYAGLRGLGVSLDRDPARAIYGVTLLTVGVLSLLGLGCGDRALGILGARGSARAVVLCGLAFGTLFLPYSTVMNNHTVCGALWAIHFFCLLRMRDSALQAALAGALLALVVVTDISVLFFAPASLIALVGHTRRVQLAYLVPFAPILAAYLLGNWALTGSPVPPVMNPQLWDYPGSQFPRAELMGIFSHPDLAANLIYGFHTLFGARGLFLYSPVLLFCIPGGWRGWFRSDAHQWALRYAALAALGITALIILRTNNYGGWNYGVRWFASLNFAFGALLVGALPWLARTAWARSVFVGLTAVSIGVAFLGTVAPFTPMFDSQWSMGRAWQQFLTWETQLQGRLAVALVGTWALLFLYARSWSQSLPDEPSG